MTDTATAVLEPPAPSEMGTFAEDGSYIPRQIVEDDLGDISLDDAYASTMVVVEDGQMVEGTVVRIDKEEVLLDIGYKSEGVIPARELSIRNDVDPGEVRFIGTSLWEGPDLGREPSLVGGWFAAPSPAVVNTTSSSL